MTEAINELATKHETFPTTGKQQIKDIATSIQSLIQQNESIKENRNDPEMVTISFRPLCSLLPDYQLTPVVLTPDSVHNASIPAL